MKGVKPTPGEWMSEKSLADHDPRVPLWQLIPVRRAYDQLDAMISTLSLSEQGLRATSKWPRLAKALQKFRTDVSDENKARELEATAKRAALADAEIAREFFNIRSLAVIGIWSVLETMTKDTVVAFVRHDKKFFENDAFKRLSISLGDYLAVAGSERASFIVDLMEQRLNGTDRVGLGRFNTLLKSVGLKVTLSEEKERDLLELQQVRNCIAHRSGSVDRRLKQRCPWISARVGTQLQIEAGDMKRYSMVAHEFALETLFSVADRAGHGKEYREKVRVAQENKATAQSTDLTESTGSSDSPSSAAGTPDAVPTDREHG